jgi:protein-arginine kinase activator protein McsA
MTDTLKLQKTEFMKHQKIIEEIAMADLRNGHDEQKMQELIERYVGVEDYETAAGIRDACKNNKYVKCALFVKGAPIQQINE